MPMTSAERQARYRQRTKDRVSGGLEAAIEKVRQEAMAYWIEQLAEDYAEADSDLKEREIAFMRRVAARPLWHREGFAEWLEMLVEHEIERDVAQTRKEERRANSEVKRRKGRGGDGPSTRAGRS